MMMRLVTGVIEPNPGQKATRLFFFTVRRLTRQNNEPNFDDFYARTLSHAVSGRRGLACDVKPATIEQHLLIKTRSTEYRNIKQNGVLKYCKKNNQFIS